ncbi:hypothetical protein [Primorskyibacter flagellatus]|uniref:hypothetical protein n=1 Tax=Primorskyibacter flagellatus TaxID=1387277 RepID=UPI003A9238DF
MNQSRSLLSAAIVAIMAFEICARLTGLDPLRWTAWAAMGGVIVLSFRHLSGREYYLLGASVLATVVAFWTPFNKPGVIEGALDQASFLMAFILLLGLLHEAAATSPSVSELGGYLTRQPPRRRYYALNGGTAIMSILFNVGVVSFLVPLIQRGIHHASPGDPLNPIRERRQLSALLRGFAWSVIWSPTAIAPLVLMELMHGVDRGRWILLGLGTFFCVMALGGIEDQLRYRRRHAARPMVPPPFPRHAAVMFLAACCWLLGMSGTIAWLTGDTIVFGLVVSCPVMLVGWLWAQNRGSEGWPFVRSRLGGIYRDSLPKAAPVAVTLACSGYIGRMLAGLISAQELGQALGIDAVPDYVLLGLLPSVIALLSLSALSPIMMAIFFGSLFGALPVMPADPTLIALSISCGWALAMTFSPFSTVVLLTGRVSGLAPVTLTWRWNLTFSLLAAVFLIGVFRVLTFL